MILAALALAAAHATQSPGKFIAQVYARYRQENFSPLARPEKFFSPKLAAAILEDSSGGEVGYLDGDPLCDCQDYGRVDAQVRALSQSNAHSARAKVHVTLGPRDARDLTLSLVMTRSGWRIADVVGADHHSLLDELQRSNAKRRAARR